jgi:hypothetical protein
VKPASVKKINGFKWMLKHGFADLGSFMRHCQIAGTSLQLLLRILSWKRGRRPRLMAGSYRKNVKDLDNPHLNPNDVDDING